MTHPEAEQDNAPARYYDELEEVDPWSEVRVEPSRWAKFWAMVGDILSAPVVVPRLVRWQQHTQRAIDKLSVELKLPFIGTPEVVLERVALILRNKDHMIDHLRAEAAMLHARVSDLMKTDSGKAEIERQLDRYRKGEGVTFASPASQEAVPDDIAAACIELYQREHGSSRAG